MSRTISYLLSRYPAISHTFFLTEITHLRSNGMDVKVASINDCDRPDDKLTANELDEKQQTFYVKSAGFMHLLMAHFTAFFSSPLRYLKTLWYAISLSEGAPRELLYRLFYFAEAITIAKWMKRTGSSHLHVHFGSEVATVALIVKKVSPISLSLTFHGPDEFYDVSKYHLSEKIEAADFIFCISHFAASQLMRSADYKHWHKIIRAPLGVDTKKFTPVKKASDNENVNLLCVGRLTPAKGQHLLIHAMAQLKAKFPQVKLTLVGDGEDMASLVNLAKSLKVTDCVKFTGAINQDHILSHYKQADIFCLPSFAEGVPVVLMEAMAMEIPCVTTRITGIPELIRHGEDGLLVNAGDAGSLVDALETLIDWPKTRAALGESARKRIEENYHLETNFSALSQHFNQQLGTPAGAVETEVSREGLSLHSQ